MAEREPWEDDLVEGLVKAGHDNFSAADSEEAMENIADPIAKAIKHGGSSGQQQSDWNETDPSKVTFIKNKPNLPSDIPSRQEMAAAIGAETTRATAAEASLQTQINGKASQEALETETAAREAADTQLQSNIDAETARAQNAESALDARLTTAESDIDSLESSVDALYNTEVEQTDGETSVSSSTSGKVKTFVVGLASAIKTKIEAAYSHISDAVKHITATERTNWNTAYSHSQTEGNPHETTIEEIDGLRTELTTIESDVAAIEGVIPSEATTTNQLADKAFVNSSITTNTATFRGTSAKNLTEAQFLAWANSLTKTKNDYCFWDTTDSDGNVVFKRYKWNDVQWEYEYTLNNSSFTAAQWAAIQSGVTAEDVADIGYNTTARHTHSNKNLLDTYTQSNASLADAVAKKHEHANKDVLDNTTASYTSDEKTKLAGIESGAEVNVNADWNADRGDAQILNKPSTFPPSSHTHTIANVTGLQTELNGKLDKTGLEYTSGENLVYQQFTAGSTNTSVTDNGRSITINPENRDTFFRVKFADNINLDEIISVSFDVEYEGDDDGNWNWRLRFPSQNEGSPLIAVKGKGHYYGSGVVHSAKSKDSTAICCDDVDRPILPTNSFKIKNLKFERGSVATGFCLCPAEQRAATLTTPRSIQTDLGSTAAPTFDGSSNIIPGVTGTLPIANGGTGATTAKAAEYNLLGGVEDLDSTLTDTRRFAIANQTKSSTNGVFRWYSLNTLWNWIAGKISSVLGLTATNYSGKAATSDKSTAGDVLDTRSTNQTPYWYLTNHPQSVVTEFKQCSTIGLTGATYTYLNTITQWKNNSGGEPFQTAQVGAKRYIRYGLNDATWSDWEELETASHVSSTYATKSEIPDVSGKADKVSGATANNFAGLNASGNLIDSGKKDSDFATAAQGTKADTAYGWGNHANAGYAKADGSNASGDWAISATKGRIVSRTDFDALVTTGTYEILLEGDELTYSTNPPTFGTTASTCRGSIEVRNVGVTTNAIIQQATYNVGYIATRRRQNNVWTSWERMTYIPNGTAVGSTTQPVYVDAQGAVQACTGSNFVVTSNQNITPTKAQLEANQYFLYRNNNATTYNLNIDADLLVDGKVYSITLVGDSSVTPNRTWNVSFKSSGGVAKTYSDYASYSVSSGTLTTSFQNVEISTTWRNKQVVRKGSSVYIFGY